MKETILTCPFTGIEFNTIEDSDKNLYLKHPYTGTTTKINYDALGHFYIVPAELFTHIDTITPSEAAEILHVTRQRISAIAANATIPTYTINGQTVFLLNDVLEYKRTRKIGAPKKE